MQYSLHSLKGVYLGDYVANIIEVTKGDTRRSSYIGLEFKHLRFEIEALLGFRDEGRRAMWGFLKQVSDPYLYQSHSSNRNIIGPWLSDSGFPLFFL